MHICVRADVRKLMDQACGPLRMSKPELIKRLLEFFAAHRDCWGLILGLGHPKDRLITTLRLLTEMKTQVANELKAFEAEVESLPSFEIDPRAFET
jgi:hypothetical protein